MEITNEARDNEMVPLALLIIIAGGAKPTPTSVSVDVVFKNVSPENVRILKRFEPEEDLPIWFSVHLTSADGTPLLGTKGGGKINLRGTLDYVLLKPGEEFSLQLNAAKFFQTELPEGMYKVSVTYHNQYGHDCFKGHLKSNTVTIIVPSREKRE
jgi:hypothetical protein